MPCSRRVCCWRSRTPTVTQDAAALSRGDVEGAHGLVVVDAQLASVIAPLMFSSPPPHTAELPLIVPLVSVVVAYSARPRPSHPPPPYWAELPLTMQLVSVSGPPKPTNPPEKGAELPLIVQLVSVVVP